MKKLEIDTIISQDSLKNMDDMITIFLYSLSERDQFELNFALHELIINALEAYEQSDLPVEEYRLKFIIEIMEHMAQMEVLDYAGGTKTLKKAAEVGNDVGVESRGRGIMFVKHYMDHFQWRVHDEGGVVVSIKKKLQDTGSGGQYESKL